MSAEAAPETPASHRRGRRIRRAQRGSALGAMGPDRRSPCSWSACWSSFPWSTSSSRPCAEGVGVYWNNLFADPDTRHSILLTLTVVPIALVANLIFGVAAAWADRPVRFSRTDLLTA